MFPVAPAWQVDSLPLSHKGSPYKLVRRLKDESSQSNIYPQYLAKVYIEKMLNMMLKTINVVGGYNTSLLKSIWTWVIINLIICDITNQKYVMYKHTQRKKESSDNTKII